MLTFEKVSFSYCAKVILPETGLSLPSGTITALCGPNGAGKTTLLKLAVGILKPASGEVFCDGAQVAGIPRMMRAKIVSYLPQNPAYCEEWTVADAAEMGDFPHRELPPAPSPLPERLKSAREKLGLQELWERKLGSLSGGECRRALLARILVQDTPFLALDEPQGQLDQSHRVMLCEILAELVAAGKTVLLTTHDINLSMLFAHRVLLMDSAGRTSDLPLLPGQRKSEMERVFETEMEVVSLSGRDFFLPRAGLA